MRTIVLVSILLIISGCSKEDSCRITRREEMYFSAGFDACMKTQNCKPTVQDFERRERYRQECE